MEPLFISKEKIAALLPMQECILVMEKTFQALAEGRYEQPLRSFMWLPDKTGLLAMMPAYAGDIEVMGIKVLSVFPNNRNYGYSSHEGMVMLFDAKHGQPLCMLDANAITAIRTAAVSAFATQLLARKDTSTLAIIGSGEQARSHIEAMMLVRKFTTINLWSRNASHAKALAEEVAGKYGNTVMVMKNVQDAVESADVICTVTASPQPVVKGEWLSKGTHINAVGSSTPHTRELDTAAILKCKLFTDRYESLFHEAGDFIIPKNEGAIDDTYVKGELSEVFSGIKKGRENDEEITLFKSLGLAVEDLFAAHYIYQKVLSSKS